MKKIADIVPCCGLCEYAELRSDSEEEVYCLRKKKMRDPASSCRRFTFDLLKYQPPRPREIPTLDPTLLDL